MSQKQLLEENTTLVNNMAKVNSQAEYYRLTGEAAQTQNSKLMQERNNALEKLQSLYSLYNIQKSSIQRIEREKIELEDDNKILQKHIEKLNNERRKLSASMSNEILTWKNVAVEYKVFYYK